MTPAHLADLAAAIRAEARDELTKLAMVDPVSLSAAQRAAHEALQQRWRQLAAVTTDEARETYEAMRELFGRDFTLAETVAVIRRQWSPPIAER